MPRLRTIVSLLSCSLAILLFAESPAHAYIDPGSGSMVMQLLVAGVAGFASLGKVLWRRLKNRFRSKED